jgi:hypothetical protein
MTPSVRATKPSNPSVDGSIPSRPIAKALQIPDIRAGWPGREFKAEWMGPADLATTQKYLAYRPRTDAARRLSAALRRRRPLPGCESALSAAFADRVAGA